MADPLMLRRLTAAVELAARVHRRPAAQGRRGAVPQPRGRGRRPGGAGRRRRGRGGRRLLARRGRGQRHRAGRDRGQVRCRGGAAGRGDDRRAGVGGAAAARAQDPSGRPHEDCASGRAADQDRRPVLERSGHLAAAAAWPPGEAAEYLDGAETVVAACRGTDPWLEAAFDAAAAEAMQKIGGDR